MRCRGRALCGVQALSGTSDGSPELIVPPIDGGHTDAVWQVKWVDKGQGRGERLVSISADGRVTEWSTKKGLVGVGTCTRVDGSLPLPLCVALWTTRYK